MDTKTMAPPLPEIFVGKDIVNARVKLYLQNKHPLLSQELSKDGVGRLDTRNVWYSKEYLQTLMNEMVYLNADGVRIYFGAYGNEEGRPEGQLCLLMVLTRPSSTGHKDIVLEDEPDFEARKNQILSRSFNGGLNLNDEVPREYNYGSPCPPICFTDDQAFPQ